MEEEAKVLMGIQSAVAEMHGELMEFKRETLKRLDTLESAARSAGRERGMFCTALISTAAGVVSCISRFLPAGRL
jgi:hypothetical protein